jgi:hypothetical protein
MKAKYFFVSFTTNDGVTHSKRCFSTYLNSVYRALKKGQIKSMSVFEDKPLPDQQ